MSPDNDNLEIPPPRHTPSKDPDQHTKAELDEANFPPTRKLHLAQLKFIRHLKNDKKQLQGEIASLQAERATLQNASHDLARYETASRILRVSSVACVIFTGLGACMISTYAGDVNAQAYFGIGWGFVILAAIIQFLLALFDPRKVGS